MSTPADFADRGPCPVGVRTAFVPDPDDPSRTLPTDLWYPGPAGYELRTLCDPLATGHNLILVGYSDAEGANRASEALVGHLKRLSRVSPKKMTERRYEKFAKMGRFDRRR